MKNKNKNIFIVIGLCGALLWATPVGAAPPTLSLITGGVDGLGTNNLLYMANSRVLSRDGRITVFATESTNQVADDNNSVSDVFSYDRVTRQVQMISRATTGQPANDASMWPTVSADGRFVAYWSSATDIVPGTRPTCTGIGRCGVVLVHDRTTGQHSVASRGGDNEVVASFVNDKPVISGNGRFVAFAIRVPNPSDPSVLSENILVRDLTANTTKLVTADNAGQAVRTLSGEPSLSNDGNYVTFTTPTQVVPADTNGVNDVYLRDIRAGTTTLVSKAKDSNNAGNNSSSGGVISGDGRYVAFHSYAGDLVLGDTRGYRDVFVRDLRSGTTRRVSVAQNGTQSNLGSSTPDITDNGRLVVFASDSSDLVPGDTNGRPDIFMRDRFTGKLQRINLAADDTQANHYSDGPAISGDGSTTVFRSRASNLIPPAAGSTTNNLYQRYNPVSQAYDPGRIADWFVTK